MKRLSKEDLAQMNQGYFQSLDKKRLVEVASNLHSLAVEQLERLEQNSGNSSKPPSSDSPYQAEAAKSITEEAKESQTDGDQTQQTNSKTKNIKIDHQGKGFGKKLQGLQPGAKGIWRTTPLVPNQTIAHHPPNVCSL